MEVLGIICVLLLIGSSESKIIRYVVAAPAITDRTAKFSATLDCDTGSSVYVAAITYNTTLCNCPAQQPAACPLDVAPSDLSNISAPCWTSPTCNVMFTASPVNCSDIRATITYMCAPDNSSLTINGETTATGSLLTARYSAAGAAASGDRAFWVCSVEASNCSSLNVTLVLLIRNGDSASFFSVPGGNLGEKGVAWYRGPFQTPFDIVLNVIKGSSLLNAFFAVADTSLAVTCGRRPTPVPTPSNNVSIVSTSPTWISGHELTAVHWTSGQFGEELAVDRVCVVETADCSTGTPVQVAFYVRNRPCRSPSYFLMNGSQVESGSTVNVTTPFAVTLRLVLRSAVRSAYFSVAAQRNLSLVCGRPAGSPLRPVGSRCAACQSNPCPTATKCVPSPNSFKCVCPDGFFFSSDGPSCTDIDECSTDHPACDVTARCNNTKGSFHCYCDPGYNLTVNGKGCTDVDECKTNTSACDVTARCNNTEGSFHCYCDPGYSLTNNDTGCTDINECTTTPPPCDVTARCNNTEGSFHCYCDPGYSLTSGGSCQDINECDVGSTLCDVTAHCNNTEGSFHCYCDPGYNLTDNGRGCLGPPITASQSLVSVLYPAVGGAVGGVVVIAVVVVIVVIVFRSRNLKTVSESESSLEFDHAVYVNNAYEDPSQSGDNHIMVSYETPLTHPEDQLYTNTGTPASAVTSEDTQDYDVLGQTRPAAAAKSDVIYSHIQLNGSQPDDVEYSYDRAGEKPRRKVITGANYETPTFKSPEDEGNEDDAQYDYNGTAKTVSPGVITDSVYHALQSVSSAGEPVQDSANNSESQATLAPKQPGAVAVDLEDGPIYTNSGQ